MSVPGPLPHEALSAGPSTRPMAALEPPASTGPTPMTAPVAAPMTVVPPVPGVPVLPEQPRPGLDADPDWFRTSVFYEALLRSFADSDGDGVGDIPGLITRLDYLA